MARIRDNWAQLVQATMQREKLRQLAREDSLSSTSSSQFSITSSPFPETPVPILNIFDTSLNYHKHIMYATRHFSGKTLMNRGLFIARFQQFPFPVIVKRIYADGYTDPEHFSIEVDVFSNVSGHSQFANTFESSGSASDVKDKFLVYRYNSKGALSKFLSSKPDEHENWLSLMNWNTRMKIAIGAAQGLVYLHHKCDPPIAHGDVQASNMLLDDNFEVRLPGGINSKFTRNYTMGIATCADDVYCFGKLLLELLTGKFGISSSSDDTLEKLWKTTLRYVNDKEFVSEILDQMLHMNTDIIEKGRDVAIIARSCLNPRPPIRPLMREVLRSLEQCINL